MTTAIVLGVAAFSIIAIIIGGWVGANLIFHPIKMLKMEIWPDKFDLPYETVDFTTEDGLKLKGWLIPASGGPTERTIMICHGWGDNKGDVLQRVPFLARRFNLFLFDFRHHGESQGDRTTICYDEAKDVEAAFKCLKQARPEWTAKLGAFGLSMGATWTLYCAVNHSEIRALALEAPFTSFRAIVRNWGSGEFGIPYYPFVWACWLLLKFRFGGNPEPFSPVEQIAKLSPRPLLFIAGELDRPMPPAMVREVFEKAPEPKEYWLVANATHGKCFEVGGAEYQKRIEGFFEKALA